MAFADGYFVPLSSQANTDAGKVWQYKEDATLAAIRAANYFNDAVIMGLKDEDIIMIIGNDGFGFNIMAIDAAADVTVGEALTSA